VEAGAEKSFRAVAGVWRIASDVGVALSGLRLTQGIGVGARSRIYLAVDIRTGQRFAVKRVLRQGPEDDRFIEQAENEYAIASRVDYPVLRKCFDLQKVRRLLQVREVCLVMEYVAGFGLDRTMPNRLMAFLNLFLRVAKGLRALHGAGYVHTDIKPNNILVAPGGVVKIIDFGQACAIGHRKERIQGTPDYIAPEQVNRGVLNQRTDVFNLGATMYYVLTLKTFPTQVRGVDARGGIALVESPKPQTPTEINPRIPAAVSNLVMDCCREDPAERPVDMHNVVQRLQTARDIWKRQREALRREHLGVEAGESALVPALAADDEDSDSGEPGDDIELGAPDAGSIFDPPEERG